MKKLAIICALVLCLFALAGCKKSPIQGTWADEDGVVYTFNSDMEFFIDIGNDIAVGGTFAIEEDSDQVVFTMSIPDGQPVVEKATFTIDDEADTLTFVGADGTTTVLYKQ